MNRNIAIGIVIVLVLVIAGILVFSGRDSEPTATATPSVSSVVTVSASATPTATISASLTPTPSASKTPTPSATTTPTTVTIVYNDDVGYVPANVTIKKGSTVIFRNAGSGDMWPASAMHPTHTQYTQQGTCFAGKFSGCNVATGGTYSMKFNVVGSWGYHDHLNPQHFGKITVTQ